MTVTDQKLKDGTAPVKESRVFSLAVTGLMAAVICVLGPLSIPLPGDLVPVSLGALGVFLASVILGWKKGLIAVLIYLLIGFVGLPVFAGFTAGAGKLFGPTGGYLIGYIPTVLIAGFFADRFRGKKLLFGIVIMMILICGYSRLIAAAASSPLWPSSVMTSIRIRSTCLFRRRISRSKTVCRCIP